MKLDPSEIGSERVESQKRLDQLCRRWSEKPALGLDTEFVRTRTFYPKLGLIQVSDGRGIVLVDALAIDDWSAFTELLTAPGVVKVLHSCSEDLEVLRHALGVYPRPIFDTQIAATIAGHGYSLGYQRLVKTLFDLELPKGETRSNWLQRPLTESQQEYAALDVAFLLPLHDRLSAELREQGREEWAVEEFGRLEEVARARTETGWAFDRLKKGRLTPRQRTVLRALSDWREEAARRRDLPRNFVVNDDVLVRLAKQRPRKPEQLEKIPGLRPGERKRSGSQLLAVIREALKRPPEPPDEAESVVGRSKGTVDALKRVVAEVAEEQRLPAEFLAQRRLLKELVAGARAGTDQPLPAELRGWRRRVVGERLMEELRRLEGAAQ